MRFSTAVWACAVSTFLCGTSYGQVFTQADGAVEGIATQGQGQALYGGMGLNSATAPEYNIYRKYLPNADGELSSATNVDGNPGEIEWVDVNQRHQGALVGEPKNWLAAPGMFIGQKNHTTEDGWVVSNPDEILYFKPLLDGAENATTSDSNRNVFWGSRFGFMENPQDFIDFVDPNSEQLDLWTGEFNTDAVYIQQAITRDDSGENSNVTTRTGGGAFKLNSGNSVFADERGRRNQETTRAVAGTGEELPNTNFSDAGVAYEDAIEVSWGMRLNDPENEDEIFGREVLFWIKTGNIITSGVFDPGGGDDGVLPDVTPNDDDEDFTDIRFNWEEATPVWYTGAQGQAQGTGRMGIFIPGDFGADGNVGVEDFTRLASNFGDSGTTYSRGDFTQDGVTDIADATAWAELAGDEAKSASVSAIEADLGGTLYDFDGSGATDAADVTLISDLFGVGGAICIPGNGDLDGNGQVEFADFLVLSSNFGGEADGEGGDIDCDGMVAFSDFLVMSNNFGQSVRAASVPEPSAGLLGLVSVASIMLVRKRR